MLISGLSRSLSIDSRGHHYPSLRISTSYYPFKKYNLEDIDRRKIRNNRESIMIKYAH